jgi:glutathione S-transferase
MKPIITAFEKSPDRGQGLARDMGVRWALEETGQPYEVRLVSFNKLKEYGHRSLHPFGKIPTFEQGELKLFESGSIVLHIAETHKGLFSENVMARSRAITWMFAALSTIEPPIVELSMSSLLEKDKSWFAERNLVLQNNVRVRLSELSQYLGEKEWLDGNFSAGDLMMITVLRRLKRSGLLSEFQNVLSYVERGEARPAFQRAFAAQLAVFNASETR